MNAQFPPLQRALRRPDDRLERLSNLPKDADIYYDIPPFGAAGKKHFRASWLLARQEFPQKANQALLEASQRWPQLAAILGLDPDTGLSLIAEENADPAAALAEGQLELNAAFAAAEPLARQRLAAEWAQRAAIAHVAPAAPAPVAPAIPVPAANVVLGIADPNNNSNMNMNGGSRNHRKSKRSTRKRKSRNARKSRK